jgi:hypothetical protein
MACDAFPGGPGFLFADAGPGPLLYPAGGSAAVAGGFLALAAVAGGLWLARRWRDRPVRGSRRVFWVCLGCAAVFASVPVGLLGLFLFWLLPLALLLLVGGVKLIVWGVRGPRPGTDAPNGEPGSGRKDQAG